MSTALLTYCAPSQRVEVRPWAVTVHPNAEQQRAASKAAAAERKAAKVAAREVRHTYAVGCKAAAAERKAAKVAAREVRHTYAVGYQFSVRGEPAQKGHAVTAVWVKGTNTRAALIRIFRGEINAVNNECFRITSIVFVEVQL